MAIDYDGAGSGLFTLQGPIVWAVSQIVPESMLATLQDVKTNIIDNFEAQDKDELIEGYSTRFDQMIANIVGMRQNIAAMTDAVWADRETSLDELRLFNYDPGEYFPVLFNQMVIDNETIARATVSLGSVTPFASNVGNGTVLITKRLDGFNPPLNGGIIVPAYASSKVNSELAFDETMRWLCVGDQFQGASEGSEQFFWQGAANDSRNPFGEFEGSGPGPTIQVINNDNILNNGTFSDFTNNIPDGWTKVTGTAVTHINQTTTTGEFYRGASGLKLIGDGALAAIELEQAIPTGSVNPQRMYCLTAQVKCSTAAPAAGNVTIALRGTGWSPDSSESITVSNAALTTSFSLKNAFILMPLVLPTDLEVYVKWGNTPTNAKILYVDDVVLTPVIYHGGIGSVVVAGSTPFAVGDYFTAAISTDLPDGATWFQWFFAKWFRVQMPSSGTPSISEDLTNLS